MNLKEAKEILRESEVEDGVSVLDLCDGGIIKQKGCHCNIANSISNTIIEKTEDCLYVNYKGEDLCSCVFHMGSLFSNNNEDEDIDIDYELNENYGGANNRIIYQTGRDIGFYECVELLFNFIDFNKIKEVFDIEFTDKKRRKVKDSISGLGELYLHSEIKRFSCDIYDYNERVKNEKVQ